MKITLPVTIVTSIVLSIALAHAQTPAAPVSLNGSIVGAWTLNKAASDLGEAPGANKDGKDGDDTGRRGGGGRRRGGGGGGGFGGSGLGRGFGNQASPEQKESAQRMRDALRDEMQAADHMTIVSSETTIIITTPDGHTTRLATDGKKVKDDATGIERKTKWDAGKLVSEISGLGRGKMTETYSADAELKQLRVKLEVDGARKTTQTRVYDLDQR